MAARLLLLRAFHSSSGRAAVTMRRFSSSVDLPETEKFSLSLRDWWDDINGPAAPLHSMNTVRVPLVKEALLGGARDLNENQASGRPLAGYRILDVGCGGGILCEALGTLGASTIGIDPNPRCISVAEAHLSLTNSYSQPGISELVKYQCCSIEEMTQQYQQQQQQEEEQFDCVIASEVIEHVADIDVFVQHLSQLIKSNGSLVFTTINRTLSSLLLAKIAAEYVLNIVPAGTHDWQRFVTPEELKDVLIKYDMIPLSVQGLDYNPCTNEWNYQSSIGINYSLNAIKK